MFTLYIKIWSVKTKSVFFVARFIFVLTLISVPSDW